jgi:hypothetical protein
VDTQHGVEELPVQDRINILFDAHGRGVLAVAGQTAGAHHAPEMQFLHEKAGLVGQGVAEAVVLVSGMYHDVRAVKRRPDGVVIEERTAGRKDVPGVVQVKIRHAQPQGEMNAGHRVALIDGGELTPREDLSVIFEFFVRVGFLGGVYQLANLDNGRVVRGFDETDTVVGWKH